MAERFLAVPEFTKAGLRGSGPAVESVIAAAEHIILRRARHLADRQALEWIAADRQLPTCEQCGHVMVLRRDATRRPFFGCPRFPDCRATKPGGLFLKARRRYLRAVSVLCELRELSVDEGEVKCLLIDAPCKFRWGYTHERASGAGQPSSATPSRGSRRGSARARSQGLRPD